MAAIAHLILSHKSPRALARLARAISYKDADIYIHVDKKTLIDPFKKCLAGVDNVFFIKRRTKVNWGGYSMVKATLVSMDEIMSLEKRYDHINLLSESDYPLKPAIEVHRFLDNYTGKSFMEMRLSDSDWWKEAQQKVQHYHWVDLSFRGKYLLQHLVNSLAPKRKLPSKMVFTGRSQWMTLATTHIQFILEYSRKNPRVIRFFRQTWGPDEFFFQTVLYNSAHRKDLINDNLRYIDWSEGKASPKILVAADFTALEKSGKLYARKFSQDTDHTILNLIDHRLLGASGHS